MKKILVVEDDEFLANAYRVKLVKENFEVVIVYDGNEAVKFLQSSHPDLILLDLVLPNRDGFSVLEEIKKNEEWKNIPCIVASNLGQKEDIDKALKLGADDYVVKTDLSMKELVKKIVTILSKDGEKETVVSSASS